MSEVLFGKWVATGPGIGTLCRAWGTNQTSKDVNAETTNNFLPNHDFFLNS